MTGEVSARDPLAAARGFEAASGHVYWQDPETKQATWTRPAQYAWKEEPSKEHAGHSYFYNTVRWTVLRSCARIGHACACAQPFDAAGPPHSRPRPPPRVPLLREC